MGDALFFSLCLTAGNVPFGQNKITYNKKKYSLHNYFVISSLDKVKDDGIVAVITSAGTLDSHSIDARSAIMDRADVIACYKLPEKVFSRNASTDVQTDLLNRTYNNYRPLDYERIAEKLSFDSMDKTLKEKLYPHQKKGIARFLFGGNILFAHGVGTGKTFEMIASVMEAKRMGIINKTAMVVPNNKLVDFKNDIAQAYPNAKVLVIDTANKKRQTMLGLVSGADSEYNILREYSLDELEYANSKINTMCNIVIDKYKKSANIKGTQIIFCDKGSGSGTVYSFNLHEDLLEEHQRCKKIMPDLLFRLHKHNLKRGLEGAQ